MNLQKNAIKILTKMNSNIVNAANVVFTNFNRNCKVANEINPDTNTVCKRRERDIFFVLEDKNRLRDILKKKGKC